MGSQPVRKSPEDARRRPLRVLSLPKRLAFAFLPLLLLLAAGELAVRIKRGMLFTLADSRAEKRSRMARGREFTPGHVYDAELGFIPEPSYAGTISVAGIEYRSLHDAEGLRVTPPAVDPAAPEILALGDSYAYGAEVAQDASWPYLLGEKTGLRVLNGGVGGYGMDQAVLRGERLLPEHPKVDTVILCLIANDVDRCAYSVRSVPKPYFDTSGPTIELRNVPAPPLVDPNSPLKDLLAKSHLADVAFRRLTPFWWNISSEQREEVDTARVALYLVDRFARLCDEHQCRGILLLLDGPTFKRIGDVLTEPAARARELGIEVLDLREEIRGRLRAKPRPPGFFGQYHLGEEGNRWVAERLLPLIVERTGSP